MSSHEAVARLLAAVASRDLRDVAATLAPDVTWQNVPHERTVGRDAVVAMLGGIITWSDDVRWDVASAGYDGDTAWVERIDRFVIAGTEHAVRCNGVIRTDGDGAIVEVRDYVDLPEWRARVGPVLADLAARPAIDVVRRHLAAVGSGDPVRMAADYAVDAVLERGDDVHDGWMAIADYFDTVPARLAGRRVEFVAVDAVGDDRVTVRWTIVGTGIDASGTDHYLVAAGRITHQRVVLDGADFSSP
jgi:limonene-1,2-epoxide hydrolase